MLYLATCLAGFVVTDATCPVLLNVVQAFILGHCMLQHLFGMPAEQEVNEAFRCGPDSRPAGPHPESCLTAHRRQAINPANTILGFMARGTSSNPRLLRRLLNPGEAITESGLLRLFHTDGRLDASVLRKAFSRQWVTCAVVMPPVRTMPSCVKPESGTVFCVRPCLCALHCGSPYTCHAMCTELRPPPD